MKPPKFAEKLGNGKWSGTIYELDLCPVCSGRKTMKFTGMGHWGCISCNKGGKDIDSLRTFLSANPMTTSLAKSIIDQPKPNELIVVSDYYDVQKVNVIGTGFGLLDRLLGGLTEGALTVVTGKRGSGKSTWIGQVVLNAIQAGHRVCFYSGELSAGRFQSWLFTQAAGTGQLLGEEDRFGGIRYSVKPDVEQKIRKWLSDKLVLYDNTKVRASDRKKIIESFENARAYYGCNLFIVDNLMTARYDIDNERDSLRAQANFANQITDFARTNSVHVILVAHQRKGDSTDISDSVSGLSDITNLATNVIQIRKAEEIEGFDSEITVAKNREYGEIAKFPLSFSKECRRFLTLSGPMNSRYDWDKVKLDD